MEKIIRANARVLTWGTGFLTSSRLDFFITVGSQGMLPARTDPKPEYVAPARLRGKCCLTEHVHGCLHCPRLICQQHVSCLQQKNAKNYRFFAILQPPHVIFTMAQSTQIHPAGHGRRTVKKTCHTSTTDR